MTKNTHQFWTCLCRGRGPRRVAQHSCHTDPELAPPCGCASPLAQYLSAPVGKGNEKDVNYV